MESWKDKDFVQISHVMPGMRWVLGSIPCLLSVLQIYCCSIDRHRCGYYASFVLLLTEDITNATGS